MKELLVLFDEYLEKQDVLSKLTEAEKLHDLGYSEIHTIVAIQELEEANVTAIAEKMHMTKGAISKIIKRLSSLGAIETYQKPDNKQKIIYSLTETGMALYEEHAERHSLWVKRDKAFIDQYSQNDIQTIQQFMTDFNLYLDKQIKELEDNEK